MKSFYWFFILIFLFFPLFLFSATNIEIQSDIYYGLPILSTDNIFYNYSPSEFTLDFQLDVSYLFNLKLKGNAKFWYLSVINQHNFFSSTDPVLINQFIPPELEEETVNQINLQKYNLSFALGPGLSIFPKTSNSVFSLDVSTGLYLQIMGLNYQLEYDNTSYKTNGSPYFASLEIHTRLGCFYKILSWLAIESFIDISVCNLNLFFIPLFIGGSNYFNLDVIFTPVRDLENFCVRLSFLYEFITFNDYTLYDIRPGFDERDIINVPRVGIGISYN